MHSGGGETNVETHLRQCGDRYEIVLTSGIYVASRCAQAVRTHAPRAALVFDTIDVHFLREYREAKVTRNLNRIRNALRVRAIELSVARNADLTLVVSDREKELLEEESPEIRAFVLPNIHEVTLPGAPFEERRDLYYLGAYTFQPNIDAVVNFVREVLPAVRLRLPGVRFYVAGADPTDEVRGLESEGAIVTGYIPDLATFFDCRRVCVVPLRYGAGIKGKVLLSMAHGVPVVTSPVGAEGIPARDGLDLMIAREAGDWPILIERVYHDRALWCTLSRNGMDLVERNYSFRAVSARVDALLGEMESRIDRQTRAVHG